MSAASEKQLARYLKAKAREEAAANHPGRPIAATGVIPWLWRGGRMPWPKDPEDICAVVGLARGYQSTLDPDLWAAHVGIWPGGENAGAAQVVSIRREFGDPPAERLAA